ncbi:lactococcin 972 family bacteriocin [Streptomyces huasconensis]|uniref:lactococcin 972 family bacteriocin n=1 Tax=Streptomyces huasconensis TaxID=1854574 RepID=UPI00341038EB
MDDIMKTVKKLAVATIMTVAAAGTMATAGPSVAATPQPLVYTAKSSVAPPAQLIGPNGEKPTKWGVAAIPVAKSGSITPKATQSVGGGTWSYGTSAVISGKKCYSNYIHPTKKHSASVAIASQTDKDIQAADIWANASAISGGAYTCHTYWGVY